MDTRELDKSEWPAFFSAFSRHYRGQPVTLDLPGGAADRGEVVARDLPLVGITAECAGEGDGGEVTSIEILLGTAPDGHLMHTINAPTHVYVEQVSNGEDEMIVIRSSGDPTVRIDFRNRTPNEMGDCPGPAREEFPPEGRPWFTST